MGDRSEQSNSIMGMLMGEDTKYPATGCFMCMEMASRRVVGSGLVVFFFFFGVI